MASYFSGYKEDDLARELMKRFVQAVGRAFYDDSKVAVLDILCEAPYYLRDGRRIEINKDENEKKIAEEEEEEEEEDVSLKSMHERMNLPLQLLRTILNALEIEEKLIKSEEVEKHKYYYIDYDWFFKMVSFRLTRMTEELGEREQSLRRATVYVCPLCDAETSEAHFRVPHCERCVGSGENTPDECRLVEQNNAGELVHITEMRKKLEIQLFMKYSPPNTDRPTMAKLLLEHMRQCELNKQPIYPIPIYDIKKILDGFLSVGVPQGGFSKNIPSESIAKVLLNRRRNRQNQDKGVFTAAHFEEMTKSNLQNKKDNSSLNISSSSSSSMKNEKFIDFDADTKDIAQIAKRARFEHGQREDRTTTYSPPKDQVQDQVQDQSDDEDEFEEG